MNNFQKLAIGNHSSENLQFKDAILDRLRHANIDAILKKQKMLASILQETVVKAASAW